MKDTRVHLSRCFYGMVVLMFLSACSGKKELSPGSYVKWLGDEHNGIVQRKELDGLIYEAKYVTPEWMALNEMRTLDPEKKEFEKVRKEYGNMTYLKFRMYDKSDRHIQHYMQENGQNGDEIESYLNNDAQNDWIMVAGSDTGKCKLYSFSKTYCASKEFSMQMAFNSADTALNEDRSFEWTDKATGSGTLKFLFKKEDLQRIPRIRI